MSEKTKEEIAQQYALEHGIVGHKVKGNRMIYYRNQGDETIKVIVRLNTLKVEEQKLNYKRRVKENEKAALSS